MNNFYNGTNSEIVKKISATPYNSSTVVDLFLWNYCIFHDLKVGLIVKIVDNDKCNKPYSLVLITMYKRRAIRTGGRNDLSAIPMYLSNFQIPIKLLTYHTNLKFLKNNYEQQAAGRKDSSCSEFRTSKCRTRRRFALKIGRIQDAVFSLNSR